jgi:ketosteroid isomerase-like protein
MLRAFVITFLLALTLTLTLTGVVIAQQKGVDADANPAAEGEIKALELQLVDMLVRGDWDEYAKHLASGYLHTRENAQVENKDELLASLRDVKRKIIVMEMEPDLTTRIYGDTAVASAEFTIRVRDNGVVKSRRSRQTDVFLKREGQWYLIAEQSTTIGK